MTGTFTESTLLDLVSADGRTGFMLRLARHVDEARAWIWLVIFHADVIHGFADDSIACESTRTVDDGTSATYSVGAPVEATCFASVTRRGSAHRVSGGSCMVRVHGHRLADIPWGSGAVPLVLDASFSPMFDGAGSNLPGRTESIVRVDASIEVGDERVQMSGLGQFHEQLQDAPRFDTSFTYMSLRGENSALVALRGPLAGGGVLHGHGGASPVSGFSIDPLDAERPLSVRVFSGSRPGPDDASVNGRLTPTLTYTVPILDGRRPSAIVTGSLNGADVSGFVNDWVAPR